MNRMDRDAVAPIRDAGALAVLRALVAYRDRVPSSAREEYHEAAFDCWAEYCGHITNWEDAGSPDSFASYILRDSGLTRFFEDYDSDDDRDLSADDDLAPTATSEGPAPVATR